MLCLQKMEAAGDPETSSPLPSVAAITAVRGEGVTPHPDSVNKMVVNYNNEQITNKEEKICPKSSTLFMLCTPSVPAG